VIPRGPYVVSATRRPSPAYLVPKLRAAVEAWRGRGYQGATGTSQRLLQFWFGEDHPRTGGQPFQFYFCQRDAIETLIYCYEVVKARDFRTLMQMFGKGPVFYDPSADRFPRYTFKMATGSGKTKVMALAMVWSYFNALKEKDTGLAKNFLLLAPNIIVFERLKVEFEAGVVFRADPLVPPEWADDWDVQVVLRDAPVVGTTMGTIYLANIQQLYDRPSPDPPNPVTRLLGPRPSPDINRSLENPLDRIQRHPDLIVLNDEAHHVHDEELLWTQTIVGLHDHLRGGKLNGLSAQLDFSATPKDQNGALFPWIIVDYPVAEAIEDGIVKRPIIGRVLEGKEVASRRADLRYRSWINAGVERWKEYKGKLEGSGRRPVLFVMAEDTRAADEIARYLDTLAELKGRVLLIHTDKSGEVSKQDLDQARTASREVDSATSPYSAIVSVLMLREGWDVRSVTVVVGLRPFTAKANILPEQVVGRGLRLMVGPQSGFEETVDVVGNRPFEDFVRELEKEGVVFGEATIGKDKLHIETILVEPGKMRYDMAIPRLTPVLTRSARPFSGIEVATLRRGNLSLGKDKPSDATHYEGRDALTQEVVVERSWNLPVPENLGAVVAYYSEQVLRNVHMDLAGKRAELIPLIREYIRRFLFEKQVDLNSRQVLRRLNEADAQQVVIDVFSEVIQRLTIQSRLAQSVGVPLKVSDTPAFPWTKGFVRAKHSVFNLLPVDNEYEARFATFTDESNDVEALAKLTQHSGFCIEYLGTDGALHLYFPDFVVKTRDQGMFMVETKGREDVEVARKDARARKWCEDASSLSGTSWKYVKVPQAIFESTNATDFAGLVSHALTQEK
jgi:type III restriction enzyme